MCHWRFPCLQVWWTERDLVIFVLATLFMLPLCFPRTLDAISGAVARPGSRHPRLCGFLLGWAASPREWKARCHPGGVFLQRQPLLPPVHVACLLL
jgi:hypothetical protein